MNVHDQADGLVGHTPLVRLTGFDTGPCELWLKLESQNPGGSIKDRVGRAMVDDAERAGHLGGAHRHLVEATAGNTGLGLALVAAQRGYRLTLVVPDKMSHEKVLHLRALGATVVTTRSDVGRGHPDYYQDLARDLAAREGAFYVNQFENPANPRAHELGTGPEIVAQTGGRLDAMVCGVGSGGTLTGLSRCFRREIPGCEMVLADPEGSVLAGYLRTGAVGAAGSWLVEGIGEDFIPPICDLSAVREAFTISDRESFETARRLLLQTGILAGSSTGTLIAAALRYCRAQRAPKRVCTLVCDSGAKYLSKVYDDAWLSSQGLVERARAGDLRDLVGRRFADGAVVAVSPDDTLGVAYVRMKQHAVSQLPVLAGRQVVGLVDESDLLRAVVDDPAAFARPVREAMSTRLVTVEVTSPAHALLPMLDEGLVPIVCEGDEFVGLVTRVDLLDGLRRDARRRDTTRHDAAARQP